MKQQRFARTAIASAAMAFCFFGDAYAALFNSTSLDGHYIADVVKANGNTYLLTSVRNTPENYMIDPDGTRKYQSDFYLLKIDSSQNLTKTLLTNLYASSPNNGFDGAALLVSSSNIYAFLDSFVGQGSYAQAGFQYTVDEQNMAVVGTPRTIFSYSNWGWFPVVTSPNSVMHFSFSGYYRINDTINMGRVDPQMMVDEALQDRVSHANGLFTIDEFQQINGTFRPTLLQRLMGLSSTITAATPTAARLDVQQSFTITGTNLTSGMGFTVEDCDNVGEEAGGTATQRTFHCTPRLPGAKKLTIKTAPGGTVLRDTDKVTVDNPTRLGDVGSRGLPSSHGVSHWNGNVHLSATDMVVPGKGLAFTVSRSYNSYYSSYEDNRGAVSAAKPWRFNWEITLGYVTGTTDLLWVEREDGSGERFFQQNGTWYPMNQGSFDTIQGDTPAAGQTTLFTKNGVKYIFQNPDLGGKLIQIQDHDGNALTVQRDANGRVGSVVDASGRSYTFTYNATGQLSRVADFSGRYVDYTWQTKASPVAAVLASVRDVRGGTTSYGYTALTPASGSSPAPQWALNSVTDPNGNTAHRYTYTDTVYGNWGAATYKNALGTTWNYTYCAQQASGACDNANPSSAVEFVTTQTPPLGGTKIGSFDTAGRFKKAVDGNQNATNFALPDTSTLISTKYNLAALKNSSTTALNNLTAFAYTADDLGNLASVTNAEGAITQRNYLADAGLLNKNLHWVSTITSGAGNVTEQTPTPSGRLQNRTVKNTNVTTTWGYDAAGQATTVTDARSNTSTRTFDTNGNITKVTEPGQPTRFVTATYDSLGRVLTSTNQRGAVTTNTWDAEGNLLSTTDALGGIVRYTYDANGNRTSMTDANGNVANYTYDALNRLVSATRRLGAQNITTTNTYDVLGRVIAVTNANSHANTTSFDNAGNVTTRTNALSDTTQYQYNAENRVIRTIDPEGRITDTTYDKVGRVKTVTTGAGSATPLTTSYAYDADGRMSSMTDPRGITTQYGYDAAGRLVALTDADQKTTRATYDGNGNMLTVTDPNGKTTTYTYDKANRPLTRTDANGQQWSTTYDESGNIKTQTVPATPSPRTTTFTFDVLNRPTLVAYPDGSTVAFTYDANGNRLTMTDSTGTTRYTYDALNRLSSKTDPQNKVVRYTYDGVGNVKTLTYPAGQNVTYGYDNAERLTSVTDWLPKTTTYTLNRAGQVTAAAFGNGTRLEQTFDASGRLTSLVNRAADASTISSHGLTLDGSSNITASTGQIPTPPSLPNVDRVFTYDAANRLATVNGAAVVHDAAGRITSLNGDTYSYNDRDQITAITGTQTASYAYNGAGHRVNRTVNGTSTNFVIDPNRSLPEVLAETNAGGAVQRNYVYGYGLIEQIDSTNTPHYYHFDPTGNTLALTNAAGAISDRYAYTPYGENTVNGTTVNPFKYVGKLGVMDDSNGLYFMRARYYRPDIARFMSLDQLAGSADKPQTLNRYAYVAGNPVTGVDPSGLEREGYSQYSGYIQDTAGHPYMPVTYGGDDQLGMAIATILAQGGVNTYLGSIGQPFLTQQERCQSFWEDIQASRQSVAYYVVAGIGVGFQCSLGVGAGVISTGFNFLNPVAQATAAAHATLESINDFIDEDLTRSELDELHDAVDLLSIAASLYDINNAMNATNKRLDLTKIARSAKGKKMMKGGKLSPALKKFKKSQGILKNTVFKEISTILDFGLSILDTTLQDIEDGK